MGKTAFITGAAGGLGLALTRYLVQRGWHVFAADCDTAALDRLDQPSSITPVFLDVTQNDSVEAAFAHVKQHTTHLDAVVNFAGILRVGAMIEMEEAVLRQLLEINLLGTWRVNKQFIPLLTHGRIVNISSETGWHTASPFNGAYAMSKYGIEAYSDALRRELSIYNIPVIKIQPGPFKTPMVAATVQGFYDAAERSTRYKKPLRHFGELVEAANQKAADPAVLAEVIYKALTTPNPKPAYSVKADPGRSFLEYLPIRWADGIFKKILSRADQAALSTNATMTPKAQLLVWMTTNRPVTWFIRTVASRLDPLLFKWTNGHWTTFGPPQMPMLVMTAIGKKSGEPRAVQVASVLHNGDYHIVASAMGQAKHPAWKGNIEANPVVEVQVTGERFTAVAEKLTAEERGAIWGTLKKAIPQLHVYEARTERNICVFRLKRTETPQVS